MHTGKGSISIKNDYHQENKERIIFRRNRHYLKQAGELQRWKATGGGWCGTPSPAPTHGRQSLFNSGG